MMEKVHSYSELELKKKIKSIKIILKKIPE